MGGEVDASSYTSKQATKQQNNNVNKLKIYLYMQTARKCLKQRLCVLIRDKGLIVPPYCPGMMRVFVVFLYLCRPSISAPRSQITERYVRAICYASPTPPYCLGIMHVQTCHLLLATQTTEQQSWSYQVRSHLTQLSRDHGCLNMSPWSHSYSHSPTVPPYPWQKNSPTPPYCPPSEDHACPNTSP